MMTDDQRYWQEEAETDYLYDTFHAMQIHREFPDALIHNLGCGYFTWGGAEWMWEYEGREEGEGLIIIYPNVRMATIYELPVVWAFTFKE
jgi:hypothetical protein